MSRYESTALWQKTLGPQVDNDSHEKERELLRNAYEKFRENAKVLAGEINRTLPDYTVHDITHIDALWDTASRAAGEKYPLTPAEAFVLGGAFLIHDLGMGLAAYPKGKDALKEHTRWKDTVAALYRRKGDEALTEDQINNPPAEIEKQALEHVLRLLHAEQAEELALTHWQNARKEQVFLIEDADLRHTYGHIIGLIAHSHWWPVSELAEKLGDRLGAPGNLPHNWQVDPVKLACILRIADAIQVDDRRAPSFLRAVRKPSAYADLHWNFQEKLFQPRIERNRLFYSSKQPFTIEERESWWVCYDTLKMIDHELKEVDALLADTDRPQLEVIAVGNIEDPIRLSKHIKVSGWHPLDVEVRISEVGKLVETLGGKQLYGNKPLVPLRELIQNASDAVRARRILEGFDKNWGNVRVRQGEDARGKFIEVEDEGIGMTQKVLTGPFLDFGKSFWGSDLMHEELPGLEAKGYRSTGRFGIGFFSAFMWSNKVKVMTKSYLEGRNSTRVLEFEHGPSARPLLRNSINEDEVIKEGGTRIRVWVNETFINNVVNEVLEEEDMARDRQLNSDILTKLVEIICPTIDVNVIVDGKTIISANDWINIEPKVLVKRIFPYLDESYKDISHITSNMRFIYNDQGEPVGRGFLCVEGKPPIRDRSFVTIGGLLSREYSSEFVGILLGEANRATRDSYKLLASGENLAKWASDQARYIKQLKLDPKVEVKYANTIYRFDGDIADLKFVQFKDNCFAFSELVEVIRQHKEELYVYSPWVDYEVYNKDVFLLDYSYSYYGEDVSKLTKNSILSLFIKAVSIARDTTEEVIIANSEFLDQHETVEFLGIQVPPELIFYGGLLFLIKRPSS